jgi:3-hydroxybutyryl-CoA dehydrogenase
LKIGIIGSGVMGAGIATVCITSGHYVKLFDANDASLEKAVEKMKKKAGEFSSNLEPVHALTDMADCQIIIEAVPEILDLKRIIFKELEKSTNKDVILASNTSGILISDIAHYCVDKDRIIGLHFFNPPEKMPLVEMVKSDETSEEVLQISKQFILSLNKKPIKVKDSPGFVVNRIVTPLINEAITLYEKGIASMEDIDEAIKLGLGHPMGPLALADFIGLDTIYYFMENLYEQTGLEQFRPANLLIEKVENQQLGRKSGAGFYVYE